MIKTRWIAVGAALVIGAITSASATAATTLENIKKKGHVQCGVTTGLPGFSQPDEKGNWTGLDVDTCRPSRPRCSVMPRRWNSRR